MCVIKFPRWTKWSIFTLHEKPGLETKYLNYSNVAPMFKGNPNFDEPNGLIQNNLCKVFIGASNDADEIYFQ